MRMVEKASVFTPGVLDSTRVSSGGEGNLRWVCAKNVTLLLILQLILAGFSSVSSAAWDGVILTEADFQALQAFKHELNDPRGFLTSWNDSGLGACSGGWEGLKCARGQVIVIQLPWRGLGGRITEKIGQLQALRKLSLHDNFITGPIPTALGFLQSLRGLQLFNNRLFGSIPASIGSCRLLQNLDLSNNLLTGSIPASLDGSTKLYRLNLSHNALSGPIPASLTRSVSLTLLSLEHNNLSGPVPDTWGSSYNKSAQAAQLLEFSVSHNQITGVIPEELSSLSSLRMLDLSYNVVNGSLPVGLSQLKNLTVLNLRSNLITGRIPSSIGDLSSLIDLDLSLNNLSGLIPESLADLQSLNSLNVSYNHLSGAVPLPLTHKFNSSSFAGNLQLCGYSKETACPTPPPSEAPSQELSWKKHSRKLGTKDVILVAAGILLVILVLLCCILIFCLMSTRAAAKKIDGGAKGIAPAARRPEKGAAEVESGGEAAGGKLVHFDGPMGFTADDLLCATAEIMGKSTYGTVYKATLEDGSRVAVKRLREKIARTSKDFEAQVNVLGRIRHPNLLALRAYYLGPKAEKLLVFDLMPKGSLAALLHARGPDTPVNWQTRMNIAQGMTRGLLHLHTQENIIHGNLTSTNVLLDETSAKIADYGLSRLMTSAANSNVMATAGALGYRAPELSKLKKASTKTDVYSLGVIILELLTGKSPGEAMDGVDLPQWVASIVKEEWTTEVFDLELMRDAPAIGDELLNTLKLALHCVDPSPSARPEVLQVLQQLEEIRGEMMAASSGDDFGAGPSSITD